jgi:hypothetical protein
MYRFTHTDWDEIRGAWYEGNREALGSAFGEDTDTPFEAVAREGYEIVAICADGSVLAHSRHKHYYYVCHDNGPWGVDVTLTVRAIFGDEISIQA